MYGTVILALIAEFILGLVALEELFWVPSQEDTQASIAAGLVARAAVSATAWADQNNSFSGAISMGAIPWLDGGQNTGQVGGVVGTVGTSRMVVVWWSGGRAPAGRVSAALQQQTHCGMCGVTGAGQFATGAGTGMSLPAGVPQGVAAVVSIGY